MGYPLLAEEYRGNQLENTHQGQVCVINDQQEVLYSKGNYNEAVYYRSAMKPLQAIPVFTTNAMNRYHITNREAALFTASQRGEIYHQDALESLIDKLHFEENQLVCGTSYPLNDQAKEQYIWEHKEKRKLLHNCAGKHLGIMAGAREKGYKVAGYDQIDHPIQQEILSYVSKLSETPLKDIHLGMDGCGLPIASVPLKNMALSYLKFAVPDLIQDSKTREAVSQIGNIMNENPEIVASHDFVCTALLKDSNIIAKGGAQGVYVLALKKERISIALKVFSGSEVLWPLLIAELLERLNYSNPDTIQRLRSVYDGEIRSDSGVLVGHTKVYL